MTVVADHRSDAEEALQQLWREATHASTGTLQGGGAIAGFRELLNERDEALLNAWRKTAQACSNGFQGRGPVVGIGEPIDTIDGSFLEV